MSTLSSGRESRSESYSETTNRDTITRRADRFPSLHLDSSRDFVNTGWQDRREEDICNKLTITERVWYWCCGISRKVWLIVGCIFLVALSLVTVGLILLFVLPRKESGQIATEATVAPTTNPSGASITTVAPSIPYPIISITGIETTWYAIGFMDSVEPDMRGYNFKNRIFAYSQNKSFVLFNVTLSLLNSYSQPLPGLKQPNNCSSCKLLSTLESCLSGGSCSPSELVFFCERCNQTSQVCLLHGTTVITSGDTIERRISTDDDGLLQTSLFVLGDKIALQTTLARVPSSFEIGSLVVYPIPPTAYISSITTNAANQTDLVVWIDSGILWILYQSKTSSVDLNISGSILSLDTTFIQNYASIAIRQSGLFNVIRFNLKNRCISKFAAPTDYIFNGNLIAGSFWAGEQYYFWYNDHNRTSEAIALIRYAFTWPNDSVCPYSS